jgi:outer membrane protein OmpA-like peptidoglycan-associated protein
MRFLQFLILSLTLSTVGFSQYKVELTSSCFNTPYDDFATRKIGNQLFVQSAALNPCDEADMDDFTKKPFSDIYAVEGCKLVPAVLMSEQTNSSMLISTCYYDGPISSNSAENLLFFTNNESSANHEKLTIHYSFKNAIGQWTEPRSFPLNNNNYNVTHPYWDEGTNTLYFSSDMPGGLGGMDLYKVSFENEKFSNPEPIKLANTPFNDIFPAFYKDNLYFTSQGHNSIGGYDLFMIENLEVKSLGPEYNSTFDDLAIFFTDDKHGYLTSNRLTDGQTDDIFEFELIDLFIDVPLAFVVNDAKTGQPLDAVAVRIIDDSTGVVLFEGKTSDLGALTAVLDSLQLNSSKTLRVYLDKEGYVSKEVTFSFDAKDTNAINVRDLVNVDLDPLLLEMDLTALLGLKSIYYDFDKADLRSDALVELDKVVRFMNQYPDIKVELGSHTDCRGTAKYNQALSNKRAENAANYIKSRISNSDRIIFMGYGESMLRTNCPCEGKTVSPCSEEDHDLNRRTEFLIKSLNISTSNSSASSIGTKGL